MEGLCSRLLGYCGGLLYLILQCAITYDVVLDHNLNAIKSLRKKPTLSVALLI
jgi:hypothetical protein